MGRGDEERGAAGLKLKHKAALQVIEEFREIRSDSDGAWIPSERERSAERGEFVALYAQDFSFVETLERDLGEYRGEGTGANGDERLREGLAGKGGAELDGEARRDVAEPLCKLAVGRLRGDGQVGENVFERGRFFRRAERGGDSGDVLEQTERRCFQSVVNGVFADDAEICTAIAELLNDLIGADVGRGEADAGCFRHQSADARNHEPVDHAVAGGDGVVDVLGDALGFEVLKRAEMRAREFGQARASSSELEQFPAALSDFAADEFRELSKLAAVLALTNKIAGGGL